MQAGIVTAENIAQILRGISQKRRHGTLEVHAGDNTLEIYFYQGKIVNLRLQGIPLARMVAKRLAARETIVARPWIEEVEVFAELAQRMKDAGEDVAPELLAMVLQQQALELLYALEIVGGSFYHFRVEMVEAPADGELQLSVGQVLLDLVALKENRDAMKKRLPEDAVVARGAPEEREYSLEEQDLIWLVDGVMTVDQLRQRSLLSRLTFDEVLCGLLDAGVLVREDGAAAPIDGFDLDSLDSSISRFVDEAVSESLPRRDVRVDTCVERRALVESPPLRAQSAITASSADAAGNSLNQRLLSSPRVPEVAVLIVLAAVALVPYFLW